MTHPYRIFLAAAAACVLSCLVMACDPESTLSAPGGDDGASMVDAGGVDRDGARSDSGDGGMDLGQADATLDMAILPLEDDGGEVDMATVGPPRMLFELERSAVRATFYDFPMPSDLRLDAQGRPDVQEMPGARVDLIEQLKGYVKTGVPGFAPHATSYVRFTHPLDTASFGAALDPSSPQAPLWLVDVDRESPDFGKKFPLDLQFRLAPTSYWRSNTLSARVIPGTRVRPGTTYALLIRDLLRTATGEPVGRSPAFQALLDDASGEDRLSTHYAKLFGAIRDQGIDPNSLLGATMYTTSDPRPQMDALAGAARTVALEPLGAWEIGERSAAGTLLLGSFRTQDFLAGEPPFSAVGSGRIEFDGAGTPKPQRRSTVRIALVIPTAPAPPGGYPVVVYSHGTGGDAFSGTRGPTSAGQRLAARGIATLAFDGALHGVRTTQAFDYATRVVQNILVVREMIRQTVVDQIVLLRHLDQGLNVPASLLSANEAGVVALSPEPWVMGHSQGGQQNGVLVGLDVPLRGAFFSAAPGALYLVLNDQIRDGTRLGCLLGLVALVKCEDVTYAHPAISLLYQQTHAVNDGLNYAGRTLLERPESWGPAPHIAMTEGLIDTTTPPDSLEALAGVMGVPTVAPSLREGQALRFLNQTVVSEPASLNVEVGKQQVTAGLFQFAGLDHFAIFRDQAAANTYINFFVSGMFGGIPELDRKTRQ